jgi:hypothetical protein
VNGVQLQYREEDSKITHQDLMPQDDDKDLDSINQEITTFEAEFDAALIDLRKRQAAALKRLNDVIGQVAQDIPAADDSTRN